MPFALHSVVSHCGHPRERQHAQAEPHVTSVIPAGATASYPSSGVFDPDAVIALTDAYAHACAALGLADRSDPLTEIIAKKVIERAQAGELDAVRLCEAVLEELR